MGFWIPAFARTNFNLGNVLLSHTVTHAVPSALKGLTSVFGMGTGVSPSPWLPRNLNFKIQNPNLKLGKIKPLWILNFDLRILDFDVWSLKFQIQNMDEGTLENKFNYGQADRPISISMLSALRHLHIWPINLVVSEGSYPGIATRRDTLSWGGLPA